MNFSEGDSTWDEIPLIHENAHTIKQNIMFSIDTTLTIAAVAGPT